MRPKCDIMVRLTRDQKMIPFKHESLLCFPTILFTGVITAEDMWLMLVEIIENDIVKAGLGWESRGFASLKVRSKPPVSAPLMWLKRNSQGCKHEIAQHARTAMQQIGGSPISCSNADPMVVH